MLQLINSIDRRVVEKIEEMEHPLLDGMMNSYTALGSFYLAVLFLTMAWKIGPKNYTFQTATGLGATWIFVYTMKPLLKRERPEGGHRSFVTNSFPSSHSATAFFLAVMLSEMLPFSILLYLLAALVAFSRIYLDLHYPSDAIAGSIIGLVAGYLTLALV